ncbi:MAG: hypothetical protein KDD84_10775, partial [Caldilineaceae bacterium]|nr:hypothetical protein [Caldilineaceae bacterium]
CAGPILGAVLTLAAAQGDLFTAGALLECIALVAFAFSGIYALSWIFLFVAGVGQAGFHTMRNAVLLTEASDEMRGRALSTVGLTQGVGLVGEMQTGLLAERIGAPVTAGAQSGGAALLSGLIFLLLPAIWRRTAGDGRRMTDD